MDRMDGIYDLTVATAGVSVSANFGYVTFCPMNDTIDRPLILSLGGINMDLVTFADRLPTDGETVVGQRFVTYAGGKGGQPGGGRGADGRALGHGRPGRRRYVRAAVDRASAIGRR